MSTVDIDVQDHVGWLTFNRPKVGNAIDQTVLCELDKTLSYVQEARNGVRCLVLTGAGQHFCSGVDLRSLQIPRADADTPAMARSFVDHIVEKLLSLRMPIVAAVQGAAAGAGMTLALTADIIVMAENACFLPSFAKLGLVPDNGITYLLSERIGAARARSALMLSEKIEAHTAYEWGLAYQVVELQALRTKAGDLAARLAAGPRCVLAATRLLLNQRDFSKQLQAERCAHREALTAREHEEGFAAFFEHRAPVFL